LRQAAIPTSKTFSAIAMAAVAAAVVAVEVVAAAVVVVWEGREVLELEHLPRRVWAGAV
jgi:hypothetical protein